MKKLRFMLWLATLLPCRWWARAWWKIYFERRVQVVARCEKPSIPPRPDPRTPPAGERDF